MPQLGASLLLIAVGAILAFATSFTITGVNVYMVGIILLVVGLVGAALSMLFWTSFAPFAHGERHVDRVDIIDRRI
ncbi:MAG: hypothetical protein IT299_07930 [Dehalococcoidia bacterium]|nr:hypothetical protein [Dehalococcoidia bacterium]